MTPPTKKMGLPTAINVTKTNLLQAHQHNLDSPSLIFHSHVTLDCVKLTVQTNHHTTKVGISNKIFALWSNLAMKKHLMPTYRPSGFWWFLFLASAIGLSLIFLVWHQSTHFLLILSLSSISQMTTTSFKHIVSWPRLTLIFTGLLLISSPDIKSREPCSF